MFNSCALIVHRDSLHALVLCVRVLFTRRCSLQMRCPQYTSLGVGTVSVHASTHTSQQGPTTIACQRMHPYNGTHPSAHRLQILTADDAPAAVRLVLHDAGTYDLATKKGGFDASIILK